MKKLEQYLKENQITLTQLEEEVLITMLNEGYYFDDGNESFLCYGIDGKRERGATVSLIKKGVIRVSRDIHDDIYIYANYDMHNWYHERA